MKLKYSSNFFAIFIIYVFCVVGIILFGYYNCSFDIFLIIVITISAIFLFFWEIYDVIKRRRIKKRIMEKNIKKKGYIIGGYCRYSEYMIHTQCLKILFENKIILISNISKNKAYNKIVDDLKNVGVVSEGTFMLKKFPIDIYIDEDDYYADLDSVKFD